MIWFMHFVLEQASKSKSGKRIGFFWMQSSGIAAVPQNMQRAPGHSGYGRWLRTLEIMRSGLSKPGELIPCRDKSRHCGQTLLLMLLGNYCDT